MTVARRHTSEAKRRAPAAQEHVFVSYARRDQDFVDRLVDTLERRGETVWIDREDIPASLKWMDRIRSAIVDARACLFVISRHAVDSEVWNVELIRRQGPLVDCGPRSSRTGHAAQAVV